MIGSLRGDVVRRTATNALIEVHGVGYLVAMTPTALAELEVGAEVFCYVHHSVAETSERLFGFVQSVEQDLFEALLKVSGVGPSVALSIVGTHPPQRLAQILADGDVAALSQAPGVGKKLAQKVLVSLSDVALPVLGDGPDGARPAPSANSARGAVGEALGQLGYTAAEVNRALSAVPSEIDDEGALLKAALVELGG